MTKIEVSALYQDLDEVTRRRLTNHAERTGRCVLDVTQECVGLGAARLLPPQRLSETLAESESAAAQLAKWGIQ